MLRRVAASALAVSALALAAAAPASATVRDCNAKVDFNLVITSARNMTCGGAKFDMKRYRGSIKKHFTTPRGFSCNRIAGGRLAGTWRCVKGAKAYRFDFSD